MSDNPCRCAASTAWYSTNWRTCPSPLSLYAERAHIFKSVCTQNAILQDEGPLFTKKDLNAIASRLAPGAWFNPHKSILGNYDVNILSIALQERGGVREPELFCERVDRGDS